MLYGAAIPTITASCRDAGIDPQRELIPVAPAAHYVCGGIRAETLSRSALVDKLHICEIRPERLAEMKALTRPATATLDYHDIINNPDVRRLYLGESFTL